MALATQIQDELGNLASTYYNVLMFSFSWRATLKLRYYCRVHCKQRYKVEATQKRAPKMTALLPRLLFGGAISCSFPHRLQDVSSIRDVPDNQEVYADPNRDESMIIELLELEQNVADAQSALWFLQDLSHEQDAGQTLVVEDVKALTSGDTPLLGSQYVVNAAVGRMAVSKGKQGVEAQNLLRVYLANIRLRNANTDVLVTVYEPLLISEQSESARVLGTGATVSAEAAGVMPAREIFQRVLATFQIHDWSLFRN